jgi:probable addiction module antidote protein
MSLAIEHYLSQTGTDPFQRWLDGLGDLRCRVAVLRRVDRMADGNPGDQRFCRDGGGVLGRLQGARMTKTKVTRKPASRSHEDATVESFRHDRQFAAAYLDQVLADGDQEELMLALRRLSEAFGGVTGLAQQAGLNSTTLYRTLSSNGNPELRTLRALLAAMGLRLSVSPAA